MKGNLTVYIVLESLYFFTQFSLNNLTFRNFLILISKEIIKYAQKCVH